MISPPNGWPPPDQLALRSGVPLGALAVLAAALQAGSPPGAWSRGVLVGLALLAACRPESTAGLAMLLVALLLWAGVPEPGSRWVLLAAGGMVLAHVAQLVAAHGPATLPVDPAQLRLWAVRGALVWLAAVGVRELSQVLPDPPADRIALAAGLLVVAVGVLAVGRRLQPN